MAVDDCSLPNRPIESNSTVAKPVTGPTFRVVDYGSMDYAALVRLREEILRKPLGLRLSETELADEEQSVHVGGFLEGEAIASAVLVRQDQQWLKMRQVAVADGLRGQGIGSGLMQFCEDYAVCHGYAGLVAHARKTAEEFYLRLGYVGEGEYFLEQSIPHRIVRKHLEPS